MLRGWRRVALPGGRWPTLRRDASATVTGVLADVNAEAARRLAAYEGGAYCFVPVVVAVADGHSAACAWIAPGSTRRIWKG